MEKMPYRAEMPMPSVVPQPPRRRDERLAQGLPVLTGNQVTLRELRASDAPSLFAMLTTEEVSRFISPPPTTVEGFERFIAWADRQQRRRCVRLLRGDARGFDTAIGIFQVRRTRAGVRHGGVGIRDRLGVLGHRRVSGRRGACHGVRVRDPRRAPARGARRGAERPRQRRAAERLAPCRKACSGKSFLRNGEYLDQALYTIVADDWFASRRGSKEVARGAHVVH